MLTALMLIVPLIQILPSQKPQVAAVEVTRLDGTVVAGHWKPCPQAGAVAIHTDHGTISMPLSDIMSLRFTSSSRHESANTPWKVWVWCNDGTRFPAEITAGTDAQLDVRMPLSSRFSVPWSELAALKWDRQPDEPLMEDLLRRRRRSKDLLWVRKNGQRRSLEGVVEEIGPDGGTFRFQQRSLPFTAAKAEAVTFAGENRTPKGSITCRLAEGMVLVGRLNQAGEDAIKLVALNDQVLDVPVGLIREMSPHSDRMVYLSDLQPLSLQQANLFDVAWPPRINKTVSNRPLRLDGKVYANGIGVHADTEIVYQLDRPYSKLAATIGIDDHVRPHGHVIFRIVADGESEVFNSGPITGRDQAVDISVDLGGARRIALVVDRAEGLDIGDHADWADARLIK